MKASTQKLTKEINSVVFENNETECCDLSELKPLLRPLDYQGSNSDVETVSWDALK